MKPPILFLTGIAAALVGVLLAAPTAPTAADSRKMRQHVDELLRLRLKPEPLPVDPPNPFAMAAAPGATASRDNPAATPAIAPAPSAPDDSAGASSTVLLARFASRLHITGLIRLKDQVHVIVNDNPWKEGDFIIVSREPQLVQLQVVRIQPGQLTLRLDEAELVLRF